MKRFRLHRHQDISGVSGTGIVAEGIQWSDGTVSVRWLGQFPTIAFHDMGRRSVEHIHGHGGHTEVIWVDEP